MADLDALADRLENPARVNRRGSSWIPSNGTLSNQSDGPYLETSSNQHFPASQSYSPDTLHTRPSAQSTDHSRSEDSGSDTDPNALSQSSSLTWLPPRTAVAIQEQHRPALQLETSPALIPNRRQQRETSIIASVNFASRITASSRPLLRVSRRPGYSIARRASEPSAQSSNPTLTQENIDETRRLLHTTDSTGVDVVYPLPLIENYPDDLSWRPCPSCLRLVQVNLEHEGAGKENACSDCYIRLDMRMPPAAVRLKGSEALMDTIDLERKREEDVEERQFWEHQRRSETANSGEYLQLSERPLKRVKGDAEGKGMQNQLEDKQPEAQDAGSETIISETEWEKESQICSGLVAGIETATMQGPEGATSDTEHNTHGPHTEESQEQLAERTKDLEELDRLIRLQSQWIDLQRQVEAEHPGLRLEIPGHWLHETQLEDIQDT